MKISNDAQFDVSADKRSQLYIARRPYDSYKNLVDNYVKDIKQNGISEERIIGLANALHSNGLFREACEVCCEGIMDDPFNWTYHLLIGYNYLFIEKVNEATAHLEMASRLNPVSFETCLYGGIAYYLLEEYEKAQFFLEKSLMLSKEADERCKVLAWYWILSVKIKDLKKAEK